MSGANEADAVFYSDGTLQVDVRPPLRKVDKRVHRPSAKLTAAELKRLNKDMPVLQECLLETEEERLQDLYYHGHGPTAHFEDLVRPRSQIVTVAFDLGRGTPACRGYTQFVVDMIKATIDHE